MTDIYLQFGGAHYLLRRLRLLLLFANRFEARERIRACKRTPSTTGRQRAEREDMDHAIRRAHDDIACSSRHRITALITTGGENADFGGGDAVEDLAVRVRVQLVGHL